MKILASGDHHFGEKNNARSHNENLLEFYQFMIDYSIENDIHTHINLGDTFHQRDKLNIETINMAIRGVDMMYERFGKEGNIMLVGNHDMHHRDTREINSLKMFREKATVIEEPTIVDFNGTKNMLCPWLCTGEEYDNVVDQTLKEKVDHFWGHMEFNKFAMNDHYVMEHGQSHRALKHLKNVFTGHYHMRQKKDNTQYLGSPFPFNFGDANDPERGFMVFDTETGDYEFINFDKVKVISVKYSDFLEGNYDQSAQSLRIEVPDVIEDETLEQINERLDQIKITETKLDYKGKKNKEILEQDTESPEELKGIDELVIDSIRSMDEVTDVDKGLLESIYREASEKDTA